MGSDKIYLVINVNVFRLVSFHVFIKPLQVNSGQEFMREHFIKPLQVNSDMDFMRKHFIEP